jgi:ribosome biogenesis GTPase A
METTAPESGALNGTTLMAGADARDGLAACITRLRALGVADNDAIGRLREKLAAQRFDLIVAGQFKRGKTSLINALVGENLLPVAVIPLTSIVTAIEYGPAPTAAVIYESGDRQPITLDDIADYVTERGNPGNAKGVQEVIVRHPSPWLRDGIRLVDTPGVGSIYQMNTDVAHRFLPNADAVLFLLSVDQPLSQAECDFLVSVRQHADRIFFVLNKIDLLTAEELDESLAFTRQALTTVTGTHPRIFPLSARLALTAQLQSCDSDLAGSRLPQLVQAVHDLLTREKSEILIQSVARKMRHVISLARLTLEMQQRALRLPMAELEQKVQLITDRRRELLLAKDDFSILLGKDALKALERPVDEDLHALKLELGSRIATLVERQLHEIRRAPLREFSRTLEAEVIAAVREGYDAFQARESATVDAAFDAMCSRLSAKVDDAIDALYRFAADVFGVSWNTRRGSTFTSTKSRFAYKFWREPTSLRIVMSSLVFALPRSLAAPAIARRMRRYGVESVEMQAGRMRYDISQRLDQALKAFGRELAARIDEAVDGMDVALAKIRENASSGRQTADAALVSIATSLEALDELEQRLARIAGNASGAAAAGTGGPPPSATAMPQQPGLMTPST